MSSPLYCPVCLTRASDGASFCRSCGARVATPPIGMPGPGDGDRESAAASAKDSCPACGGPVKPDADFCGRCGWRVRASGPPGRPQVAGPLPPRRRWTTRIRSLEAWSSFKPALVLWVLLLAILGVGGLVSQAGDSESPAVGVVVTILIAIVVVYFFLGDRGDLLPLLRRSGITDRTWWMPFATLLGLGVFMTAYLAAAEAMGIETQPYLEPFREHGWPLWIAFVLVSVFPGLFEEMAFRGFIFGRLRGQMKESDALIVQAAMFSVLHFSPLIFPSHFVMGLGFGWLRIRTASLWPASSSTPPGTHGSSSRSSTRPRSSDWPRRVRSGPELCGKRFTSRILT